MNKRKVEFSSNPQSTENPEKQAIAFPSKPTARNNSPIRATKRFPHSRHLDTSYVDVDVQPAYVRVAIKGKVLQLVLPCEVATDRSVARRNTTTGSLLVTMPRLASLAKLSVPVRVKTKSTVKRIVRAMPEVTKREFLEIGPPDRDLREFLMVVKDEKSRSEERRKLVQKDEDFVDDPSVPPLE